MSGIDPNGGGALVVPGGGGTSLSDATPAALGPAAAGVATSASRADHVHEAPAGGTTHTSGTLAARPASPAAGDTYEVTTGAASGDRYACFVAAAWTLVSCERDAVEDTPVVAWRLDEASGVYVSRGSTACDLTVTGAAVRDTAIAPSGRKAFRQPGTAGIYAAGPSGTTGLASGAALSISFWTRIRAATGAAYESLVLLQYDSTLALPFTSPGIFRTAGGLIDVLLQTTGTAGPQRVSGGALPVDATRWKLVGITWDGTTIRHWVDAVMLHSWTPTGGPLLDLGATSRWATGDLPGGGSDQSAADTADIRIYDAAKDAAWWEARYARGLGHYRGQ